MEPNFKSKDINDILQGIDEKVDIIFRHQMLFSTYAAIPRDYNLGYFLNEVEAHSLGFIHHNPGITARDLGARIYRTKGTVSTMISHLEEQGLVEQRINPNNLRERNLYLTEKGEYAHSQHVAFDRTTTCKYLTEISRFCTPEEIDGFFKVLHYRSEYFESVIEKEKAAYAASRKDTKSGKQKAK